MPRSVRQLLAATAVGAILGVSALGSPSPASAASAPGRPGPLSVVSVSERGAVVHFGRSSGKGLRYRIKANGRTVLTTRRTSRVHVPLACGRIYKVVAVAVDARGRRSAASPGARLRTRACVDRTAPTTPGRLSVTSRAESSVTLSWAAATDRVGVTGYLVYRNGTVLGGSTGRSYVARSLKPNTSYTFSVRARDRAGNLSRPVVLTTTTARPPQSTGDVRAYVLTTDDGSFRDAQTHYRDLDRVFPTFFDMSAGGDVVGTGRPSLTKWFQDRGVLVLPRFHSEDPAVIESIVTNPTTRDYAARQIAKVVSAGGYDGANLDFEMGTPTTGVNGLSASERANRLRTGYSAFIEEIGGLVHARGGLLSVAVSPDWCSTVDTATRITSYCTDSSSPSTRRSRTFLFDYERIAAASDEMWVMAWGLHWATSEAGPVADLRWLSAVTDYYHDLFAGSPSSIAKLTLGTNLYAMDWSQYVLRTDRISWPGTPFPSAPKCADSSRVARATTSYEGVPGSGTLVIDWICITRYAATWEFQQIDPTQFATSTFDADSAENVLTAPDPSRAGAQRMLWYVDQQTIGRRAELAAGAGWHLGFWRLGREDQAIWSLPALTSDHSAGSLR